VTSIALSSVLSVYAVSVAPRALRHGLRVVCEALHFQHNV